jgi:hypothetical protein
MIVHVRNRQRLGAIVALVGLGIILIGVPYLAARAIELATDGVQITATVTGKSSVDTSDPNQPPTAATTAYHLQYAFTPPGSRNR